ncbi:MAG TPA: hypothetical protein VFK14_07290 [Solirubrobacterales bacterium]|nr:hypothetical protein [Solirubrobacterales bacterium]
MALELHGKAGFVVYFQFDPQRHVAVVSSQKGGEEIEARRGRWLGAAYAVHASPEDLSGRVHLRLGHVGLLRGHFVAEGPPRHGRHNRFCHGRPPLYETGHFVGRIVFRGDGGYLGLHARRAKAYRSRSFRLRCSRGHAHHEHNLLPGLFGYVPPPLDISSENSTFLFAHLKTRRRVLYFQALHYLREQSTTFRAAALEWLPEDVATTRWVEASRVAASTFQVDEAERHPRVATLAPPLPFHGEATYLRERRQLRGNLRASFLGENLRLTGHGADAELCRATPEEPRWLCR